MANHPNSKPVRDLALSTIVIELHQLQIELHQLQITYLTKEAKFQNRIRALEAKVKLQASEISSRDSKISSLRAEIDGLLSTRIDDLASEESACSEASADSSRGIQSDLTKRLSELNPFDSEPQIGESHAVGQAQAQVPQPCFIKTEEALSSYRSFDSLSTCHVDTYINVVNYWDLYITPRDKSIWADKKLLRDLKSRLAYRVIEVFAIETMLCQLLLENEKLADELYKLLHAMEKLRVLVIVLDDRAPATESKLWQRIDFVDIDCKDHSTMSAISSLFTKHPRWSTVQAKLLFRKAVWSPAPMKYSNGLDKPITTTGTSSLSSPAPRPDDSLNLPSAPTDIPDGPSGRATTPTQTADNSASTSAPTQTSDDMTESKPSPEQALDATTESKPSPKQASERATTLTQTAANPASPSAATQTSDATTASKPSSTQALDDPPESKPSPKQALDDPPESKPSPTPTSGYSPSKSESAASPAQFPDPPRNPTINLSEFDSEKWDQYLHPRPPTAAKVFEFGLGKRRAFPSNPSSPAKSAEFCGVTTRNRSHFRAASTG